MSQDNVAVARRWVELFNAHDDVDEFLSLHDPEVVVQTPGGPRLRGHDQVRDWLEAGYENVQSRILPERFVVGGDTVVGLGRTEIRWIESGEIAYEGESAGAYWFRDGKIIRWQPFETHAAALEETGLRTSSPARPRSPSRNVKKSSATIDRRSSRDDRASARQCCTHGSSACSAAAVRQARTPPPACARQEQKRLLPGRSGD